MMLFSRATQHGCVLSQTTEMSSGSRYVNLYKHKHARKILLRMNYTNSYKILIKICDDKYVQSQVMQDRICIAVMTTTNPLDKAVWRICLNAELAHII